jgi:hypothetical protein
MPRKSSPSGKIRFCGILMLISLVLRLVMIGMAVVSRTNGSGQRRD